MPFRSSSGERLDALMADPGLAADVRRLLAELIDELDWPASPSECTPPLDLIDTGEAYELVLDIPGVSLADLRVLVKHDLVVILGEKRPSACGPSAGARFHLAERAFGRFARAVRLRTAIDGTHVQASLKAGELHLTVPKVPDRRARDIVVTIVHS
jgi:HSP20 family protein